MLQFGIPKEEEYSREMNQDEVQEFLSRSKVGVVASLRSDGYPHSTPVWYRYDGETIIIWTDKNRYWVRNVMRDNRVSFSIQDEAPPFAALTLRGRAALVDQMDDSGLREAKDICRRYVGDDEVDEYVEAYWPKLYTFVKIRPERINSWNRGY